MWIRKPFFEYATGTLLVVIIIYFLGKIDYFFWPIQTTLATIFAPILISGLLYYLLRPLVRYLTNHMNKTAAIAVIFIAITVLLMLAVYYFGPLIKNQVQEIVELAPQRVEDVTRESEQALDRFEVGNLTGTELKERAAGYFERFSTGVLSNLVSIMGMLINIAVVLVVVPFILFFLLKDDDRLKPNLLKYLHEEHKAEGEKVLKDVDFALSAYIIGQVLVAVTDGVLMYIGYLIIGLEYALSLAIFAMFLIIVPFLGPLLGIIPALFVALASGSIFMAVKVLLVLVIVQQLEGNLVTPNVMGSRLDIHPLTIILLLLIAASLYGFIGLLIAIPVYAVIKTLLHNFRLFMRLRRKREIANNKQK